MARTLTLSLLALGSGLALAVAPLQAAVADTSSCADGIYCGWEDAQYNGVKIIASGENPPGFVDVGDDTLSSAKNNTNADWCGWNKHWYGDGVELRFDANTRYGYVGDNANDKIDYFTVRGQFSAC